MNKILKQPCFILGVLATMLAIVFAIVNGSMQKNVGIVSKFEKALRSEDIEKVVKLFSSDVQEDIRFELELENVFGMFSENPTEDDIKLLQGISMTNSNGNGAVDCIALYRYGADARHIAIDAKRMSYGKENGKTVLY